MVYVNIWLSIDFKSQLIISHNLIANIPLKINILMSFSYRELKPPPVRIALVWNQLRTLHNSTSDTFHKVSEVSKDPKLHNKIYHSHDFGKRTRSMDVQLTDSQKYDLQLISSQ